MTKTVSLAVLALISAGILQTSCSSGGGNSSDSGGNASACTTPSGTPDFPFPYQIHLDGSGNAHRFTITSGGGNVAMEIRPFGAHGEPHTGHMIGDQKQNWMGLLWHDGTGSLLVELGNGDSDGICETGETCGMPIADALARVTKYYAPSNNFVITSIKLEGTTHGGIYYGTTQQWNIQAQLCPYIFRFGHVGSISSLVTQKMIAQGDIDPATYTGALDVNLLSSPITLSAGDEFATPQLVGMESTWYPGNFEGKPWMQIEVPTAITEGQDWISIPFYSLLPDAQQNQLRSIRSIGMQTDPYGLYADYAAFAATNGDALATWITNAEGGLTTVERANWKDYSSIYTALGQWFEKENDLNQGFGFWKIDKTTALYNPGDYENADVSALIQHSKVGEGAYRGEILTVNPGETSGTILVKWRMKSKKAYGPTYQKLSYSLDQAGQTLKVHLGTEHALKANAEASADPASPAGSACDGTAIICADHLNRINGLPGI